MNEAHDSLWRGTQVTAPSVILAALSPLTHAGTVSAGLPHAYAAQRAEDRLNASPHLAYVWVPFSL
jgi:hypothetical protein